MIISCNLDIFLLYNPSGLAGFSDSTPAAGGVGPTSLLPGWGEARAPHIAWSLLPTGHLSSVLRARCAGGRPLPASPPHREVILITCVQFSTHTFTCFHEMWKISFNDFQKEFTSYSFRGHLDFPDKGGIHSAGNIRCTVSSGPSNWGPRPTDCGQLDRSLMPLCVLPTQNSKVVNENCYRKHTELAH